MFGDTSPRIDVGEVNDSELRWWDSVCDSTRGRSRFPIVLLQRSWFCPVDAPSASAVATVEAELIASDPLRTMMKSITYEDVSTQIVVAEVLIGKCVGRDLRQHA
jgi:hypothetical protein